MDGCLVPLVLPQPHRPGQPSPAVLRRGQEDGAASCHLSNTPATRVRTGTLNPGESAPWGSQSGVWTLRTGKGRTLNALFQRKAFPH